MSEIHYSVSKNNYKICKFLLDHGININLKGFYNNQTALHFCVEKQYIDLIILLLENNADKNIYDDNI